MFGFKQLPWWASCVSAELARILTHEGVPVAGVIIDDILMDSPHDEGVHEATRKFHLAQSIMHDLGVTANDKSVPPCKSLTFTGLRLHTTTMSAGIDEEHRTYTVSRIQHILSHDKIRIQEARSLGGSLSWLCFVMPEGRPRRNEIYAAIRNQSRGFITMTKPLKVQLRWWLHTLTSKRYSHSRMWPLKSNPPTLLMRTDASNITGFGTCVSNLHIFGSWRPSLAPLIDNDMLFKEGLPFAVSSVLLAPLFPNYVFASSSDNAGMVFRVVTL